MIKSSRGNRLSHTWHCSHCRSEVDARTFRLDPVDSAKLVCPNQDYGKSFAWGRSKILLTSASSESRSIS